MEPTINMLIEPFDATATMPPPVTRQPAKKKEHPESQCEGARGAGDRTAAAP
jgi:hypothetical protein